MPSRAKLCGLLAIAALAGCAAAGPSAADDCTMRACAGGGGEYGFCVTQTFTGCRYQTSDGTIFQCRSCGDCTEAAAQAMKWCGGGPPAPAPHQTPALDGGAVKPDGGGAGLDGGGATTPDGGAGGGSTCDACAAAAESSQCAQAAANCRNDPACPQLAACYDSCAPNDANCFNYCDANAPPYAIDELNALGQCLCGACSASCVGRC